MQKKTIYLSILSFLAISSINCFSQINKNDFEASFLKSGITKFDHIFVFNQRTYNADGSSGISYSEYGGEQTTYELTSSSILLSYYSDNTKSKLNGITAIPYSSIKFFVMGKELSIHLNE